VIPCSWYGLRKKRVRARPSLAPPRATPRWHPGVASHGRRASSGGSGPHSSRPSLSGRFRGGSHIHTADGSGSDTPAALAPSSAAHSTRSAPPCTRQRCLCLCRISPAPLQDCFTCSDAVPSRIVLRQLRAMAPSAMAEIVARAGAHSGLIFSVAYSPDGTEIVSGSVDKTIKVWDAGAFWPQITSPWPKLTAPAFPRSHARAQGRKE